jgi:hypothetical protein
LNGREKAQTRTVISGFKRSFENFCLLGKKQPQTDTHFHYYIGHYSVKVLLIVKLRKAELRILVRGSQKTIEEF